MIIYYFSLRIFFCFLCVCAWEFNFATSHSLCAMQSSLPDSLHANTATDVHNSRRGKNIAYADNDFIYSWFYDIIYCDVTIEIDHTAHLNEPSRVASSWVELICVHWRNFILNDCTASLFNLHEQNANLQPQLMSCIFSSCLKRLTTLLFLQHFFLIGVDFPLLFCSIDMSMKVINLLCDTMSLIDRVDDDDDIEIAMNSICYCCGCSSYTILKSA